MKILITTTILYKLRQKNTARVVFTPLMQDIFLSEINFFSVGLFNLLMNFFIILIYFCPEGGLIFSSILIGVPNTG